ncbi:MAG: beta-lactamase family protein [Streptococcaceae bacterium]|jgi:CubicO group peptidase (beta-lactamase class C family)|nr:beta-lactamase family protein [Streptococcaceae bacterium]
MIDGANLKRYVFGDERKLPKIETLQSGKLWDLASVSKVVGVGAVLIDEILSKNIDLDQKLYFYLPVWNEKTVTIRQLLTHTSGIDPFIKDRNEMEFDELKQSLLKLTVTDDKAFHYSDVNFILLGFALEEIYQKSLQEIFAEKVFLKRQMKQTDFGPIAEEKAVVSFHELTAGIVHDPKARVLGQHCGSAGLFSSLDDMVKFVQFYFEDGEYLKLYKNYSPDLNRRRSLGWGFQTTDWLIHTGYTGTFVMMNLHLRQAVIFMSNRVHLKDERQKWIDDRDLLINDFIQSFK